MEMTPKELELKYKELHRQIETLATPPDDVEDPETWVMDDESLKRWDELVAERDAVGQQRETLVRQMEAMKVSEALETDATVHRTEAPFSFSMKPDPYDVTSIPLDADTSNLRARIETGLERDKVTPAEYKEGAMRTMRNVYGDKNAVAKRYLFTGSNTYRAAFSKLISGRQLELTDLERQAVARAQSLTDAAGGFAVPFTLDPTIIGIDGLSFNPFRRISRVVQTTTDSWNGVTGTAVSFSWDAEAAEVSDDAITLAQPSIPVYKLAGFVPFSVEIGGDWQDIDGDLRTALMEGRDNAEATAHAKGTGSGQPTGIETALDGTASELAPATAETFALADLYTVRNALPPRHRQAGPVWVMNIGTSGDIHQFDTVGGGNLFWGDLTEGGRNRLLGYEWVESSTVDDSTDINPAATEDNFILYLGNWSRYVIVDRVGMSVELVPHLFGNNNRPTGQRGLYAYLRTGADSVDDNAFRVLSIPTTL